MESIAMEQTLSGHISRLALSSEQVEENNTRAQQIEELTADTRVTILYYMRSLY
jgi:hypothetical protein